MYLGNRIFGIVYVYLIGMLFLSACAEGERYINNEEESIVALEEVPNSETIYQENIAETMKAEKPWIEETREFFGLVILIVVLLIDFFYAKTKMKRAKV